jgi:SAM-dependent methyltransferase
MIVVNEPKPSEIFWEIHSKLPREGPGDDASTRKAFSMLPNLPNAPRILDVGCGPGMQTIELARITDGSITALDTHQPFLDELAKRAKEAGVSERITTVRESMFAMPFPAESFDLIWSEGAIYFMGLREGLARWKPLLRARGYIVITEPCWLKSDIADELRAFWREYPGMTTVENCSRIVGEAGYREVSQFTLPEAAWWDDYYRPIERRLSTLRQKHKDNPAALMIINETQNEIDMYRAHSNCYGYVFFVIQRE